MTEVFVAGKPREVDPAWLRDLEERVRAAEKVCSLVGINATDRQTERGKALTQAWMEWSHAYGGQSVRVSDDEVSRLAAVRDARVAETLDRIRRDYPEVSAKIDRKDDARVVGSQESTPEATA